MTGALVVVTYSQFTTKILTLINTPEVRSGDLVGLYYPNERKWLGCPSRVCRKSSCPGRPTSRHGFASVNHWHRCTGEIFRIYSRRKPYRAIINSQEDIALYHVRSGLKALKVVQHCHLVWELYGDIPAHLQKLPTIAVPEKYSTSGSDLES